MLIAVLLDRPALTMRNVAIAALVILIVSPESIFDPSFDGDLAYANSSDGVTNLNQVFGETVDLSGGALVDMNGRLVGINSAIYSRSGGSIGIGFATWLGPLQRFECHLMAEI